MAEMSLALRSLMATVQSFFPIFHWHVYKKKREGGREGSERISRQVNCRRALCHAGGLLSSEAWKRRRNSPWVFWLQAPFVFSATLSLVGFLSARHMAKKKREKKKRGMKPFQEQCKIISSALQLPSYWGSQGCLSAYTRPRVGSVSNPTPTPPDITG